MIDKEFYELKECKVCGGTDCYDVLDLGYHPVADTFLSKEQLSEPETCYPLRVEACPRCGLMQTKFIVSPYIRYQKNIYCYESSSSATAVRHFNSLAEDVIGFIKPNKKGLIVDVGSNVGILLKAFQNAGYKILGVDPSPNISAKANAAEIETLNDFFNLGSAKKIIREKGNASIITATNVLNHIDDIHRFMRATDHLLQKGGTLVIEVPYLLPLIKDMVYDTIYHEHVSYFSVKSLNYFLQRVGYEIFHAEANDYYGGTLRVFSGRNKEHQTDSSATELSRLEEKCNLYDQKTHRTFASNVYQSRDELVSLLYTLKNEGKKIVGVGAPTKGNTLMNFCHIGNNLLDFTSDIIPEKIGRYTPGTHIAIVTDETVRDSKPDYVLLLSWNLADEIIKKLRERLKFHGKFIIPIPFAKIISEEV